MWSSHIFNKLTFETYVLGKMIFKGFLEFWNDVLYLFSGYNHGNIKPENVLLGNDGFFKLSNFGSAKMLTVDHADNDDVNVRIDSNSYSMTPETTCNKKVISKRW